MKTPLFCLRAALWLGAASLVSCADYTMTTPVTSKQEVSWVKGVPPVSGKPDLRTPSSVGVFVTRGTSTLDIEKVVNRLSNEDTIRFVQPVNVFVSGCDYPQLEDVLSKRAKLIHETAFLGHDVLLVCDQNTETDDRVSLVQMLTLGILDFGVKKQSTQLTMMVMDARTGYIYGTMGQHEEGHVPRAGIMAARLIGDPDQTHLVHTTREDAINGLPGFWNQVVAKYSR